MEVRRVGMVSLDQRCAACGATLREHRLAAKGVVRAREGVAPHHFHQGVAAEAEELVADFELEVETDELNALLALEEWE